MLTFFCLFQPAKSLTAEIDMILRKLSPDDIRADNSPTTAKASKNPELCLSRKRYATPAVSSGVIS